MTAHHVNGIPECLLCEQKLTEAHPDLAQWFRDHIKPNFKDCHISWSYRGMRDQNQAHAEGKSKLSYPMSAHNKCDDQGNPCSLALDLFQLSSNGMASWPWSYFRDIANYSESNNLGVSWSGRWVTFSEADHYQLGK